MKHGAMTLYGFLTHHCSPWIYRVSYIYSKNLYILKIIIGLYYLFFLSDFLSFPLIYFILTFHLIFSLYLILFVSFTSLTAEDSNPDPCPDADIQMILRSAAECQISTKTAQGRTQGIKTHGNENQTLLLVSHDEPNMN